MKITSVVPEVAEVTIADVTEIGCDTIGSDTELEDDLPCDEEVFSSEGTFHAPIRRKEPEEGSMENLNVTLTEEPPAAELGKQQNICFMTAEQLKALQENADMILNTLRDVEISDEEMGGVSNGEMMLEDETMSLVSNESDEELSPDLHQKGIPPDCVLSPTYNGMVALPQNTGKLTSKYSVRKSSLPQFSPRKKPAFKSGGEQQVSRNKYNPESSQEIDSRVQSATHGSYDTEDGVFDTRTFTRKKSNIPRDMIPSIPVSSEANSPSSPKYIHSKPEVNKSVPSRIVGIWKNSGKVRSKSAADISRGSKLQAATSCDSSRDENRNGWATPQRSSSESSPSLETEDVKIGARRPNSLALAHQSPIKQPKGLPQRQDSKKSLGILSPTSSSLQGGSSNIPKSKIAQIPSLIPSRRSFIPTPASKLGGEN